MLRILLITGIVAGTIFGLLLKMIEQLTYKKVYVLLLNVDYFPLLKNLELSEIIEFSLHLLVSMIVVIVLYYGLKTLEYERRIAPYIWINVIIGVFLFLTTSFSERTPELTDMVALMYWLGGHAIFGALVGMMIYFFRKHKCNV